MRHKSSIAVAPTLSIREELRGIRPFLRPAIAAERQQATRWLRAPLTTTFAASAVIQGLNVVTGITLARELGPHARGEVAAVFLWVMLVASAGQLGLPEAVTYHTASQPHMAGIILGVAGRTVLVLSFPLILLGGLIVTFTLRSYGGPTLTAGYLALVAIPLYMATNVALASLQGLSATRSFNAVRAVVFLVTAVGLVSFAFLHALTVRTATYSYIGAFAITLVCSLGALRAHQVVPRGFDRALLRGLLGYGLRSETSFVTSTLIERLDQLLISVILGAAMLGLYVVAVTLASGATLVASTIGLVAFPRVAALADTPARINLARRYFLIAALLSVVMVVPMLVFTPQLLELFFGRAFGRSASVCRILLVASVFLAFTQLLTALLRGLGRPFDVARAGAVGLAITAVLLGVLLPTIGLMGAAVASLVAYFAAAALMMKRVARALDIPTTQFLFGSPRQRLVVHGRIR